MICHKRLQSSRSVLTLIQPGLVHVHLLICARNIPSKREEQGSVVSRAAVVARLPRRSNKGSPRVAGGRATVQSHLALSLGDQQRNRDSQTGRRHRSFLSLSIASSIAPSFFLTRDGRSGFLWLLRCGISNIFPLVVEKQLERDSIKESGGHRLTHRRPHTDRHRSCSMDWNFCVIDPPPTPILSSPSWLEKETKDHRKRR